MNDADPNTRPASPSVSPERIDLPGGWYFKRTHLGRPWFGLRMPNGNWPPTPWTEDEARAFAAALTSSSSTAEPFQARVKPWLDACFGPEIAGDKIERNHRFLEEALELVQSTGCTRSEAHQLVDYVFGRDIGDPHQEAGGVMNTLAALCLAHGMDMHEAGETELARVWTKVEQIRAKQAAKPKHSPLPGPSSTADAPSSAQPSEPADLARGVRLEEIKRLVQKAIDLRGEASFRSVEKGPEDQEVRAAYDAAFAAKDRAFAAIRALHSPVQPAPDAPPVDPVAGFVHAKRLGDPPTRCPTCGVSVRVLEAKPFVFEDEEDDASRSRQQGPL